MAFCEFELKMQGCSRAIMVAVVNASSFAVRLAWFVFISVTYSPGIRAELVIEGPGDFSSKVRLALADGERASKHLARLIQNIKTSSSTITIRPITNDRSTWHRSGKKSRSHTEAKDGRKRGVERNYPVDSVIYINKNRISKDHKTYGSGTLIHEVVHAADLANGRYNGNYVIREKRAVFFQNIWRDKHSRPLRNDYHGRFPTHEYQEMKKVGGVSRFAGYYFTHNDLP